MFRYADRKRLKPHQRNRLNILPWIAIGLVIGAGCIPLSATSYSRDLPADLHLSYLGVALGSPKGILKKPSRSAPFSYRVTCSGVNADRCNRSFLNKRFKNSLGYNPRFFLRGRSDRPDFQFVYTNAAMAPKVRAKLSDLYSGQFSDSNDPDCQLYYSIKEHAITKVTIVISLDAPELKQKLCDTVQLSQGLGLSLLDYSSFSELWSRPPENRTAFSEHDISNFALIYGRLTYIHLCPYLKPGMNLEEAERVLSGNAACYEGLFLPDGK